LPSLEGEQSTTEVGLFTPPASPCTTDITSFKPTKSKKRTADQTDIMLIEALQNDVKKEKKDLIDADISFAESIVPILKNLNPKQNRMAKIEIQQVLLKYEFESE